MATPIVNKITERIKVVLESVADIKKVQIFPHIPTDRPTAEYPFSALRYDLTEWEWRNRFETNVLLVTIGTVYQCQDSKEDINQQGLYLEAVIHQAIVSDTSLPKWIQNLKKLPPDIDYEDERFATLIQQYELTYLHTAKNPFTQTNA